MAARAYREAVRTSRGSRRWRSGTRGSTWGPRRRGMQDERDGAARTALDKARRRDHLQAAARLTRVEGDERRFVADPPLVSTLEDVLPADAAPAFRRGMTDLLADYWRRWRRTGVGSRSGTGRSTWPGRSWGWAASGRARSCGAAAGRGRGRRAGVPGEGGAGAGAGAARGGDGYAQQGQRVVEGQRLMQAVSDVMLGWQRSAGPDGVARDYYVCGKPARLEGGLDLTGARPTGLTAYGRLCAWRLARAHARSGDAIAIGAYLGGSSAADEALADFVAAYADRTESDHADLEEAVDDGRLPVVG